MSGICMRGKPGWGDLFGPLTTVVQTFGGNWYDMDWNATVDTPEWKEAVGFYKTMLDESGEADPVSYSFPECLTALKEGKAAMWADATVAASLLEADDSPVKGKMGYVPMPVVETDQSGWLWSWNLAVPSSTKQQDAAVDFVKWATSKDYIKLVGEKIGWTQRPAGFAHLDLRDPGVQGGRRGLRTADPRRDELGQPGAAGRQPAAVGRHPVRLDPRVPGRRQPVRPARGGLPGRPDAPSRTRWASARASPRKPATSRRADVATRDAGAGSGPASRTRHPSHPSSSRRPPGRMKAADTSPPHPVTARRTRECRHDDHDRQHAPPIELDEVQGRTALDRKRLKRKELWTNRGLMLPAVIFLIVMTQIPFLTTIGYSLTDWNLLYPQDRQFAGLDNYTSALTSGDLWPSIVATVQITALSVTLAVLFGLLFAVLLDRQFRGRALARTLMITPFLIMPAAASLIWKYSMFDTNIGMVNWALRSLGLPVVSWGTEHPMATVVIVLTWQFTPFMMLILLAGLQGQDKGILEAALVDGAGPWRTFTWITLPHLRMYIEIGVLLGSVIILQVFDPIAILTKGTGGTKTLAYLLYERAFIGLDIGQAAAYGVVTVILTIIVATIALKSVFKVFMAGGSR